MKLRLPLGSFGAYLFDCDGTIADSMPLHYIAWKKALAEWNCTFDEQLFYTLGGTPVAEIVSLLNKKQGLNMPVESVSSRKENLYMELLPQLKAVPEVMEQIDAQHGRIPFAVVSGSTRESAIDSTPWSALETTKRASRTRNASCWRPPNSELRLKAVSFLKIRTWAFRQREPREWLP